MLRAGAPRFSLSATTSITGSRARTASTEPSVDPLSTTITGAS
jgi:hypothetical protein